MARLWVCPACGTPYHEIYDPPKVPGLCDREGAEIVQRDDDRPEVVRSRLEQQVPPMREVVAHYEAAGVVQRVDGERPIEEIGDDILRLVRSGAPGDNP